MSAIALRNMLLVHIDVMYMFVWIRLRSHVLIKPGLPRLDNIPNRERNFLFD